MMSTRQKQHQPHHGQQQTASNEDPLTAFCARFTARSWREFTACPNAVKDASATIARNYGVISVCDKEEGLALVHYRDTTEEDLKERARKGEAPPPGPGSWQVKGCIFDARTGTLRCRGFAFTPCISILPKELERALEQLPRGALVREWVEGLVVRVWTSDSGEVRASMTRKINALRSRRDGCPSVEEMFTLCKVDLSRMRAGTPEVPRGTVFVLLLVHPSNQTQNPLEVEPRVYHLDSWVATLDPTTSSNSSAQVQQPSSQRGGRGGRVGQARRAQDTLFSLRRKDVDIGLPRLPALTTEQALELFSQDRSVYVQQQGADGGVVYRSKALGARYTIRGEQEHLYHRYVTLGTDGHKLLDCVPFAQRERVREFPTRLASDLEALLTYCEGLFEPGARLPPGDTSLCALYESAARLVAQSPEGARASPREVATFLLGSSCKTVVLYNMISTLRTKFRKRERHEPGSTSDEVSTPRSPSPAAPQASSPVVVPRDVQ
jgi:hypothetical protein